MGGDGLFHPVEGLVVGLHVVLFQLSVARGKDDLIFAENGVFLQQLGQSLGAGHAVQNPEGMGQLRPQLRRGIGVFFLSGQGVEELFDLVLMDKTSAVIGGEKLVQVKGEVNSAVLAGQVKALLQGVIDHGGELVGKHGQSGQGLIGVIVLPVPVLLGLLLVGIAPVVDLLLRKPAVGQGFKGRAGEVQGVLPADVPEGPVRFRRVHALVGFVDDQQVKLNALLFLAKGVRIFPGQPAQLVVLSAEVYGAFQPLQGLKGHHSPLFPFRSP